MTFLSSQYFIQSSRCVPDSPKVSLIPILRSLVGCFSERTEATASQRPHSMLCSSTTTTLPVFSAEAIIASASSGLIVWILRKSTDFQLSSSIFATINASYTIEPVAIIVISEPSSSFCALPISIGIEASRNTGKSARVTRI